jgi:hypothetical protein
MATPKPTLVGRTLVQIDLAFWCLHEHPLHLAGLGLPILLASGLLTVAVTAVARTWTLSPILNYALYVIVFPWFAALIVTFAPLPGAVFAWHRASGQVLTPGQCFLWCVRRGPRLARVAFVLGFGYLLGLALFGLPLLIIWPRTCLAPHVALFENERRIFRRGRKLLREDTAIIALAALYLCLSVVLSGLLFLPRFLLESKFLETSWARTVKEFWWAVELVGGGILLSAMALCWCISLTLLYREIRRVREGEELRERLQIIRERLLGKKDLYPLGDVQK